MNQTEGRAFIESGAGASTDWRAVIRIAGAYVAWVMGSGFATGQEILQFFTSYGYYSFALLGINLIGFLLQCLLTMYVRKNYICRTPDKSHGGNI